MSAAAAKKTITTETIAPVIDIHSRQDTAPAGSMPIVGADTITDFSLRAAYFAEITPQVAQRWLGLNINNREKTKSNLTKLGQDMLDGNYRLNGESIIVSSKGKILDGQHRLTKCAETGVSIISVVVTGIEEETQSSIDTGVVRTLAHNLQMSRGLAKFASTNLASAIVITRSWDAGTRTHDGSGMTVQQGLAWLDAHPELIELSAEATRLASKVPSLTTKQVAAFIWTLDKIDADDRKFFFDKLSTGIGLDAGDPILVLRNILLREDAKRTNAGKMHPFVRMALTAKAWNAWRDGVTVKTLTWRGGGTSGEAFPEPR